MNELRSYSQAGQDRFALAMIGAAGTFLDVGANDPVALSNTYGLEEIGWTGVLVELDPGCARRLMAERHSPVVEGDATKLDWRLEIGDWRPGEPVSYLSLDVDEATPVALGPILGARRFRCLTVEHDGYRFGFHRRDEMVERLAQHGYEVLCADVCHEGFSFEIWAVDPLRVDMTVADRFRRNVPTDWKEFFL